MSEGGMLQRNILNGVYQNSPVAHIIVEPGVATLVVTLVALGA